MKLIHGSGFINIIKLLLNADMYNESMNIASAKSDITPLFTAVTNDHGAVVSLLVSYTETDVNKPDRYGVTPLHQAVTFNNSDIVRHCKIAARSS